MAPALGAVTADLWGRLWVGLCMGTWLYIFSSQHILFPVPMYMARYRQLNIYLSIYLSSHFVKFQALLFFLSWVIKVLTNSYKRRPPSYPRFHFARTSGNASSTTSPQSVIIIIKLAFQHRYPLYLRCLRLKWRHQIRTVMGCDFNIDYSLPPSVLASNLQSNPLLYFLTVTKLAIIWRVALSSSNSIIFTKYLAS